MAAMIIPAVIAAGAQIGAAEINKGKGGQGSSQPGGPGTMMAAHVNPVPPSPSPSLSHSQASDSTRIGSIHGGDWPGRTNYLPGA